MSAAARDFQAFFRLTCELRLYLTGFLKRGNRLELRKISQKSARGRHTDFRIYLTGINYDWSLRRMNAFFTMIKCAEAPSRADLTGELVVSRWLGTTLRK